MTYSSVVCGTHCHASVVRLVLSLGSTVHGLWSMVWWYGGMVVWWYSGMVVWWYCGMVMWLYGLCSMVY